MLEEFLNYIKKNHLIRCGDRILMAVSGGVDSMVMSHLFLRTGIEVGIAHCNFRLRAKESDKDEELVRKFSADHNIPFYLKRFNTREFAKKNGLSVQMAARELRYNWFETLSEEYSFNSIAVAHNLNDNIETLLINLTRGTGIAGLTGMKPLSNKIIRPLLFATRQKILDYSNTHGIVFREDKSNADTKYIRNKIRHKIIPVLKEINPSVEITLNETAEKLNGIYEILTEFIAETKKRATVQKGNDILLNISKLKSILQNQTFLYELFKPYEITEPIINDLKKIIYGKTGGQIFTRTHRMIKNRTELIVSPIVRRDKTIYEINDIYGLNEIPEIKDARFKKVTDRFKISSDPTVAYIDSEKISFPLIVRKWQPGDYFYPLGMKQKKKLSDYFTDKKYSLIDKETILIIESAGKIVWIMGERLDNRFRITESTKKALIIKANT
jgi:tRNA(Ile)-lysidine synthase